MEDCLVGKVFKIAMLVLLTRGCCNSIAHTLPIGGRIRQLLFQRLVVRLPFGHNQVAKLYLDNSQQACYSRPCSGTGSWPEAIRASLKAPVPHSSCGRKHDQTGEGNFLSLVKDTMPEEKLLFSWRYTRLMGYTKDNMTLYGHAIMCSFWAESGGKVASTMFPACSSSWPSS